RRGRRLELSAGRALDDHRTPGGNPDRLAVECRERLATVDEVELLLGRSTVLVLGNEHVALVLRDGVDAERGDAEVVANRLPRRRPVRLHGWNVIDCGDLP